MNSFPHTFTLSRPMTRHEHKSWLERYLEMNKYCSEIIVDHWGADSDTFGFSFEEDLQKFKEHFKV